MTLILKNLYIDKVNEIINKQSNAYHSTIKIKPIDVKSNTHIISNKENNKEGSEFLGW